MTLLKRLVLLFPGGAVLSFATLAFLLASQKPGCSCSGPNGFAKANLSALNRAYQATHIDYDRFADASQTAQKANIALEGSEGKHQYRSERVNRDVAVSYAVPQDAYFYPKLGPFTGKRRPTYYSYVSAIAFNPNTQKYNSIICKSAEPSSQPLSAPMLRESQWQCPAGAEELT